MNKSKVKKLLFRFDKSQCDVDRSKILSEILKSFAHIARALKKGDRLYRVRTINDCETPNSVKEISYPDPEKFKVNRGRCNYEDQPVFYCSSHREVCMSEIDLTHGQKYVLSEWRCVKNFVLIPLGYTKMEEIEHHREEQVREFILTRGGSINLLQKRLYEWFSEPSSKHYDISALVSSILMGDMNKVDLVGPSHPVMGLVYKSVAFHTERGIRGDNVALPKCAVDTESIVPLRADIYTYNQEGADSHEKFCVKFYGQKMNWKERFG